ncbi:MAG TPA: polyphosphate kinase 2 family protein [Acidimicrobiales bacterium]|nr:polyphosphate kinase 2 family protein [Acidimicrobiales bacterium]
MGELVGVLRVEPQKRVRLSDFDPAFTAGFEKKDARKLLKESVQLLSSYQVRLAAEDTRGVLLCLQGMDAAGKDSTIRHVMSGVNPQGVQVTSFKQPSAEELRHDYLWRYAQRLPAHGEIGVFNRSQYEEVLVVRVHPELLTRQRLTRQDEGENLWSRRFTEINNWERYASDSAIRVLKVCLNLSNEEQRVRFLRRLDLPDHNWKFSASDVRERRYWDDYQHAYSEALSHTSTEWAPWYVVPADHKWFGRLCVSAILLDALMDLDPQFPSITEAQRREEREAKASLLAEAPEPAQA